MLFLIAVLLLGLVAFVMLGVEDTKFHKSYTPVPYEAMSPLFMRWEDSLPGRPALPWSEDEDK